jgi:outer membrane protein assembly factor BamB
MRNIILGAILVSACSLEQPAVEQTDDSVQELTGTTNWFQHRRSPRHTAYNPIETSLKSSTITGLKVLWQRQLANGALGSAPSLAQQGSRVFVNNGDLIALSTSGNILWRESEVDGKGGKKKQFVTAPAYTHGLVYSTSRDALFALSTPSGQTSDDQDLPGSVVSDPLTKWWAPGVGSVFVIARGKGNKPSRLVGSDTFEFTPTLDVELPWAGPVTDPAAANGRVYVSGKGTAAYDGLTGDLVWSSDRGFDGLNEAGPAVLKGRVFVRSGAANVSALDEQTGATLWSATTAGAPAGGFAVTFDRLYVASNSGNGNRSAIVLEAFDVQTGSKAFSVTHATGSHLATDLSIAADVVYFGTLSGKLLAANAANGTLQKTVTFGGAPSTPVIAEGRVYVGTRENRVYALGL